MTEREVTLLRDFITWQSLPFIDNVFSTRDETIKHFNEWLIQVSGNQQPCEDCISREAVVMELDKYLCGVPYEKGIDKVIKELPSVTPQRPKGKWIRVVDKAGHWVWECGCKWQQRIATNYCPDCGAEMSGGGEE